MTIGPPQINIKEDEVKIVLVIKLLEEEIVSLGKAAKITGYSEKAFAEILIHKGVSLYIKELQGRKIII
ncbi:MAG: UPF0175 family protein [bacterium]